MKSKYPQAVFDEYFDFIDACSSLMQKGSVHRHHIAPQKQFPELRMDSDNLIVLMIEKHKQAHRLLMQCESTLWWGNPKLLDAQTSGAIKGGRITGVKFKEQKLGIFAPGMQSLGGRATMARRAGIHAPGMAAKGGSVGGRITGLAHKVNGTGLFRPGIASQGGKQGSHTRWHTGRNIKSKTCTLCMEGNNGPEKTR